MWGAKCTAYPAKCKRSSCLHPGICPHFAVDQTTLIEMLHAAASVSGVKHLRVASGVRHDLAMQDARYVRALVRDFVGGQLKIAPEHLSDAVLKLMRKPEAKVFEEFLACFEKECASAGKKQFIIPYLISAFPGCTPKDMQDTANWFARRGWRPQQVQCFIPLPGTMAAAMYYSGMDPDGRRIPVARTDAERLRMHHMLMADERPKRKARPGSKKPRR